VQSEHPALREAEPIPIRSADPTPYFGPRKVWFIRIFAIVSLLYATYYIAWRWTSTLNPDALVFSIAVAGAETYGLLTSFFLLFTVWRLRRRQPKPAPDGLSVDVYITTYDEPLEIIRRTAIGARDIRYPHTTYILDDGKRDEVHALAEELGIGYIRREGSEHAKAGNLNNALGVTDGEFILQLDADHVPLPHILDRLLGFFDDPKVAFVQSPQDFYNTDSFTHAVNEETRRVWEEQRIFFSLIQPGKDTWNAAFFCGSCGVLRRKAIEEIGGFSVETITEDMETSLILHGRGWKSVYHGESLAYGLAPGSAGAFHIQRLRWGQGSMQILRKFNPLTHPGLSVPQRVCYFASVSSYLDGLQKLVLYLAPVVFFLTGFFPLRTTDSEFLIRFVPYLVLSVVSYELLSRGMGSLWRAERYNMAKFFTYILALSGFFARGKLKFNVTPKGVGHVPFKTYAPQLALAFVSALSVVWAILAFRFGWIDYQVAGWGNAAFLLNFMWVLWNFALAAYVVQLSLHLRQQREDHRFTVRLPVRILPRGRGGRKKGRKIVITEDLNPAGMSFRAAQSLKPGTRVQMRLPLSSESVQVEGEILRCRRLRRGPFRLYEHGVRFTQLSQQTRDAIERHCMQHSVPLWHLQNRPTADLMEGAAAWLRNGRTERRHQLGVPVVVQTEPATSTLEQLGVLEEISNSGARLVLDHPIAPGTAVSYRVPGTEFTGRGTVVVTRAWETALGVRFAVGLTMTAEVQPDENGRGMTNMWNVWKRGGVAAGAVLAMAAMAQPLQAQIQPVVYGGMEVDTEDLVVSVLGASVQSAAPGWGWVADLHGYWLQFPQWNQLPGAVPEERTTGSIFAMVPAIGVRSGGTSSAIQLRVGYALLSDDAPGVVGTAAGASGVTTTLQGDVWGTGERTASAIANYNWGADYYWTRLRGAQRIAGTQATSQWRLGAEVGAQGQFGDGARGFGYQAFQAAPVVEWQVNPGLQLASAIGVKTDNRHETADLFPYFRLEFVLVP
jgi:cellulose synthase (UDP-forming)